MAKKDSIDWSENLLFSTETREVISQNKDRTWYYWQSLCGSYRLSRLVSRVPSEANTHQYTANCKCGTGVNDWKDISRDEKGYSVYFATMAEAYECVLVKHIKVNGKVNVKHNKELFLAELLSQGHVTPTPKARAPKVEGVKQTARAPRAPRANSTVGKDDLGCRLGYPPANINAVISDVPKSLEEIGKEAGVEVKAVRRHLLWCKKRGAFTDDANGKWRKV